MSYQVLARKYRPRGFSEVIGQEHAVRALANALDRDQLHHAYLFTGTRGVGKTTLARILAACLNCETGVSSTPCGECSACRSIREGRFVDLIEVDAASRTGVDDTRDLLNNVQYLPSGGRYKVYLIDEVHMLSTSSFNALLKTLEEPPEHVKFLLATTEAKRIPVTVLSRCLQINLKNIPPETIVGQLEHILSDEGIEFEDEALRTLARAADGSMRDAESLTDQAIAHGGGTVSAASVVDMLGVAGGHEISALLESLAEHDARRLLEIADELSNRSANLTDVLNAMIRAFHDLAVGLEVGSLGDETLAPFLARFSAEDLQLYYQIGLMGSRDLPFAPDAKTGFDMTLLRLAAFEPAGGDAEAHDAGQGASDPATAGGRLEAAQRSAAQTKAPAREASVRRIDAPSPAPRAFDEAPRKEPAPQSQPADLAEPSSQNEDGLGRPTDSLSTVHVDAASAPREPTPPDAEVMAEAKPSSRGVDGDGLVPIDQYDEVAATPPPVDARAVESVASDWHGVVARLAPRGVALMILDNTNLISRTDSHWLLCLDEDHDTLLNEKQKTEIAASISQYVGQPIRLDWQVGTLSEEAPGARKQRLERERHEAARSSLLSSESVQVLMREFDATLMEVTAIDPGADRPPVG